jgi:hypothetical protein
LDDSRRKRSAALNEELNFAHRWLRETPCAAYTAANVSRSMRGLAVANIGEELGGGMILDEYSHYFNVRRKADVAPTLALLRRSFLVGTTEDMPGADVGPTCLLPCSLTPIELLASPASLRSLCSFAPLLLPCCSLAAPLLLPCCSLAAPLLLPCCSLAAPLLLPCCSLAAPLRLTAHDAQFLRRQALSTGSSPSCRTDPHAPRRRR